MGSWFCSGKRLGEKKKKELKKYTHKNAEAAGKWS
jgi:hypothetical protein